MRQVTGLCCVFVNLLRFIHENSWPGPSRAASPAHLLPRSSSASENTVALTAQQVAALAGRDTHSASSGDPPGEAGDKPENPTQQPESYGF